MGFKILCQVGELQFFFQNYPLYVNDYITFLQWIILNIVSLTSLIKSIVYAKKLLIFCMAKQRRKCDIVSFKATSTKKEGISIISTVPK